MATIIDKTGIRANKIVSDNILTSENKSYVVAENELAPSNVVVTNEQGNLTTSISNEELMCLSGVTGDVQTQLNTKAAASTLTSHISNTTAHITTAERTAWNAKQVAITGAAATITDSNLAVNMVMITDTDGKAAASSTISTTELGYLDGVTSNIQTQLNAKQATVIGGATTITDSNLTINRALISNDSGKVAVSAVTSTELGYLDGVTSNVQTQLDAKATSTALTSHADNTAAHITDAERTTWNAKAPTSHASSATTYGVGNGSNYGHLKLSDSTSSTSAVSGGIAATPAAVKAAYDLAATISTGSSLTVSRALVSDTNGKVAVSAVTSTELGYLDGVTSNVQTQLNAKAPTSHASSATTYGIGTSSNYGHVKLSDSTSSTSAATAGIAATPKAVKAAYDLANAKLYIPDYTAGVDLCQAVSDIRYTPYTIPSNGMIWAEALSTPNNKDAYLSFIINGTEVAGLQLAVGAPSFISGATSPYQHNSMTFPVKKGWTIKLGDNDVLGYSATFFPYTYA